MMRRLLAVIAVVALTHAPLVAAEPLIAGRITEAQVKGVIDAMEAATRNGDARTVASYMTDDCVLTTSFPGKDGGKKVSTKDKRKYIADETAEQAKTSDHVYVSTTPTIDISADGKVGKASYKATQIYQQEGKKVEVIAYEIATVELRNGEPAVTAMDVDAVSMTIDDRRIF
jgi:ketosteroid isomerase-like protein